MLLGRFARTQQVHDIVDLCAIGTGERSIATTRHGNDIFYGQKIIFGMGVSKAVSGVGIGLAIDMWHAKFIANDTPFPCASQRGVSFRNDLYDLYKANRPEPPEDLVPQFPLIRDATRAFSLPCIEVPGLEAVIAPIGGGGMISGTCLTMSTLAPGVKIYAAEPEQADDAYRSFKAGHIIADDAPVTVADGLKVPLKDLTWHFVQKHVTDILTTSEQDIIDAMRLTWARMKIVIEPSCAVPLAAILKNPDVFRGRRVGVIITGGNVDLDKLPWM